MRLNDPLQTLYQLMSGRQPAAVTVSKTGLYWMKNKYLFITKTDKNNDYMAMALEFKCNVINIKKTTKKEIHSKHGMLYVYKIIIFILSDM